MDHSNAMDHLKAPFD